MVLCVDTTLVVLKKHSPFITETERVQDNVDVIICCLFHPSFVCPVRSVTSAKLENVPLTNYYHRTSMLPAL
jgi:hypothetical protein